MLQDIEADVDYGFDQDALAVGNSDEVGEEREDPSDQQVLEEIEDVTASADDTKGHRKSRIQQPKLNEITICGERGIPTIPKLFQNFAYDEKADTYKNLDAVMNKLEHWAHCLFPKLAFDDFIARAEILGHKRPVQTCLTKIRLDMPLTDEDFAGDAEEVKENEEIVEEEKNEETPLFPGDFMSSPPHSPMVERSPSPPFSRSPSPSFYAAPLPVKPQLTDEQKRRMEENRQKALEIRRKKMAEAENTPGLVTEAAEIAPDSETANKDLISENLRTANQNDNGDGKEIDEGSEEIENVEMLDEEQLLMSLNQ